MQQIKSYYLPRARINYGIFNIHFQGPRVWNSHGKDIKSTPCIFIKEVIRFQALLSVADPGEGPGGPAPPLPPPLFLDQTEARRAEKNFSGDKTAHEIVSTVYLL